MKNIISVIALILGSLITIYGSILIFFILGGDVKEFWDAFTFAHIWRWSIILIFIGLYSVIKAIEKLTK